MTLPRRRKSPKMGVREPDRIRCLEHMQWLRGHECIAAKHSPCSGRIVAHHVGDETDTAMGLKPGDDKTVPLCWTHHQMHHDGNLSDQGWRDTARMLWQLSPHGRRYRKEKTT